MRAKTLFATHYHELTTLADHLPRVENVHVAADERDGDVTFLRTVREGPTDRSYGIHVADLAGVPRPVVDRADDVLERLRDEKAIEARGGEDGATRQAVFDLSSGSFKGASADGGSATGERPAGTVETESPAGGDDDPLDPAVQAVLDELEETDVNGVSPIELMAKVQAWQERLDE